jgi:glycosyltransferase involved in cell wall biosynthesis
MKTVFLVHSLRGGGAERIVLEIASGLIKRGENVSIIGWIDENVYSKSEYPNLKYYYILKKVNYHGLRSIPKSIFKLRNLINELNPDIIQIHSPNVATLFAFCFLQYPVFHVLHGYGKIDPPHKKLKSYLLRIFSIFEAFISYKNLVVVSNSMLKKARLFYIFNYFKIKVIKNGVDCSKFNYQPLPLNELVLNISIIGTICENKGQASAIESIVKLIGQGYNVKLFIIGSGPEENYIKQLVLNKNLSSFVEFVSVTDRVLDYLHKSNFIWILSKTEAMPMVALEAMAAGVAVVGFNVRGVNDAIENNKTGILVEYGDINKLVEATLKLTKDTPNLNQILINARKRAEEIFSLDLMISDYATLSRKIINRK